MHSINEHLKKSHGHSDTPPLLTEEEEIKKIEQQLSELKKQVVALDHSIKEILCTNQNLKSHLEREKGKTISETHVNITQHSRANIEPTNHTELQNKRAELRKLQEQIRFLNQQKNTLEQQNEQMRAELNRIASLKRQYLDEINNIPKEIKKLNEQYIQLQSEIAKEATIHAELRCKIDLKKEGIIISSSTLKTHAITFPKNKPIQQELNITLNFHIIDKYFKEKKAYLTQAEKALQSLKDDKIESDNETLRLQQELTQVIHQITATQIEHSELKTNIQKTNEQYNTYATQITKNHLEINDLKCKLNTENKKQVQNIEDLPHIETYLSHHQPTAQTDTLQALKAVVTNQKNQLDKNKSIITQLKQQIEKQQQEKEALTNELKRIEVFKTHQELLDQPLSLPALMALQPLKPPVEKYKINTKFKDIPVVKNTTESLAYLALKQHLDDIFVYAIIYQGYPLHCPEFGEFNPLLSLYTQQNATALLAKIESKLSPESIQFLIDQAIHKTADDLLDTSADLLIWLLQHEKLQPKQAKQLGTFVSTYYTSESEPFIKLIDAYCKSPQGDFGAFPPEVRLNLLKKMDFSSIEKAYLLLPYYTKEDVFECEKLFSDLATLKTEYYELWLQLSLEAAKKHLTLKPNTFTQSVLEIELKRVQTFKSHEQLLQSAELNDALVTELSRLDALTPPTPLFESRTPFKGIPAKRNSKLILPAHALQHDQNTLFVCAIHQGYPLHSITHGSLNPLFMLYKKTNASALLPLINDKIDTHAIQFMLDQLDITKLSEEQVKIFFWLLDNQKIEPNHAHQLRAFIEKNYDYQFIAFLNLIRAFFVNPIGDFATLAADVRFKLMTTMDITDKKDQHQLANWFITNKTFHIHALFENHGEDHYIHCIRVAEIASENQTIVFQKPDSSMMNTIMKLHLEGKGLWGSSDSLIHLVTNKPQIFREWFLSQDIRQEYQLALIRLCPDLFKDHPTPLTPAYIQRADGPNVYVTADDNDALLVRFAQTSFSAMKRAEDVLLLAHTLEQHQWQTPKAKNTMLKLAKNRILETMTQHMAAPQALLDFLDQRRPQSMLIYFIPKWLRFNTTSRSIYNSFFTHPSHAEERLKAEKNQTEMDVEGIVTSKI